MKIKNLLYLSMLFFSLSTMAQTYTITSNGTGGGNWDDASTWLENRLPVCGDIIHVVSDDVVEISGQENYSEAFCPGDYMYLMVEGTLEFASNGPKLRFPCSGSYIEVGVGGSIIRTGGGGGQNNYIDICDDVVWTGSDPDIIEPIILTGPLPIDLLSFSLKEVNGNCDINWATASEVNNDYFTIERSRDLSFWEVISIVDGSGNSSQLIEYSHRDPHPWPGTSYYRLRQTDYDGVFETYGPEAFVMGVEPEISLYPNPADMRISLVGAEVTRVKFRDALGRNHALPIISAESDKFQLDVSELPDGVYQLEVILENGAKASERLFILH